MINLRKEIAFYTSVMQNGVSKGELSTIKKKIKYIIRNIFLFSYSKKIAQFLLEHKYLKTEVYRYPVLCSKIHRPYVANFFKVKDKVKIITSSYLFLDNHFKDTTLNKLYKNGKIKICDIIGKNDEVFSIYLHLYTNFEKEGEFNLICYNHEKILAKLTFSSADDKIFIGGLQGLAKGESPDILKEATKNLYGIFPKKLIIEALYFMFPNYEKIAIANESHIYLATRYKFKKYRSITANYDEFWESINGTKLSHMWFLPIILERKNIEDIPSKKRSMYNNRFTLLDQMNLSIRNFMKDNKR